MGERDFPKREKKKAKKEAKKAPSLPPILNPVAPVEVIRVKGKKSEEE